MSKTTDVNIVQTGQSRAFVQLNGANPNNQFVYYGQLNLGESEQDLGSSEPTYLPSSERPNTWEIIDMVPGNPSLGSMDITHKMNVALGDPWIDLSLRGVCLFNLQVKHGRCARPDNINDWQSKVLYIDCRLTSLTHPSVNPLTGEDNGEGMLTGSIEWRRRIPVRRLTGAEKAASTVVAEVVDGFWNDPTTLACDDCVETCQGIYLLTVSNSGSPGLSSQLVYSTNGGLTFANLDIVPFGGASAARFAPVGQYTVIVGSGTLGHVYGTFADIDNGTSAFTLQASGYVASKFPRALYVKNPALTLIAAAGGYVYKLENPVDAVTVVTDGTVTTQNLNDIHGNGDTIVAVGAANAVIYSDNNGDSFSAVTGPEAAVNLTGVFCLSDRAWFVTTGTGKLWFTVNKGRNWTQKQLPSQSSATVLNDIRFSDDGQLGYIAAQFGAGATAARVYTTTDGGNSWELASANAMRLQNVPAIERLNVVVPCGANTLLMAGRVAASGDGTVSVAKGLTL